mgnify:FL=1
MPESPKVVRELTELIFIALCRLRYLEETEGACDQDAVDADIKAIKQKVVDLRRMRTELEDLLAWS